MHQVSRPSTVEYLKYSLQGRITRRPKPFGPARFVRIVANLSTILDAKSTRATPKVVGRAAGGRVLVKGVGAARVRVSAQAKGSSRS